MSAARAIQGAEPGTDPYFARLSVVYADPVRLKIVNELYLREMSPSGFHRAFGGMPLSRVAKHFARLRETGWLRLVRKGRGEGRRNAVESYYRAPELAFFDNDSWARLPVMLRTEFSWRIFRGFTERVRGAAEAGTLDGRPDRYFTWTPLVLDEQGRTRVLAEVDGLFFTIFEEQEDAKLRLAHSGEEPIRTTVCLAAFDSPGAGCARPGSIVPAAGRTDLGPGDEFGARIAKLFRSGTNLEIVNQLSLREMSAGETADRLGGEHAKEIDRRLRLLVDHGWLSRRRPKVGGRAGGKALYRVSERANFDAGRLVQVADPIRGRDSWQIFEQMAKTTCEAMTAGTFDGRLDSHHTLTPLALDQLGWEQVIEAVDRAFSRVLEEQRLAKRRLRGSGEKTAPMTALLAAFESAPPPMPEGLSVYY